jgi:threonine dehydrogenase-like Zn-dependent dehydrogenase
VDVGPSVSRVRRGDLVVPTVRRPCPHERCVACRQGRQDFCYTGDFTERGIKQRHGFMTELVVDDESFMNVIPAEIRDVAVLVEPLTIAEKALAQVRQVQRRLPWGCAGSRSSDGARCHRAVVLGAGPVGLLGAMALAVEGFEVTVFSREPAGGPKAALVESLGATYVSGATDSVEMLAAKVGNIDLVYEAVGASALAFEVIEVLGVNGVFVFTGVPGRRQPVTLDTDLLMRNLVLKNQVVFGSVNAGRDAFEAAIRDLGKFVERWPEATRSLVTGRHPVDAHAELLAGKIAGIKNVIAF